MHLYVLAVSRTLMRRTVAWCRAVDLSTYGCLYISGVTETKKHSYNTGARAKNRLTRMRRSVAWCRAVASGRTHIYVCIPIYPSVYLSIYAFIYISGVTHSDAKNCRMVPCCRERSAGTRSSAGRRLRRMPCLNHNST